MEEPDDDAPPGDDENVERMLEQSAVDPTVRRLPPDRHAQLRSRVLTQAPRASPAGTITLRAEEGAWRSLAPGVTMKVLRVDRVAGNQTILIRMSPGAVVAGHQHSQEEECFIVDGEIRIGNHRLCAGDMHVACAGSIHEPIASPTGAVLLVRAALDATPDFSETAKP